jgi:hypothetical protein
VSLETDRQEAKENRSALALTCPSSYNSTVGNIKRDSTEYFVIASAVEETLIFTVFSGGSIVQLKGTERVHSMKVTGELRYGILDHQG